MKRILRAVRSIQWKMVLLYMLMTVIVMEVVSIYLLSSIEGMLIRDFEETLTSNAGNIASRITPISLDDEDLLHNINMGLQELNNPSDKAAEMIERFSLQFFYNDGSIKSIVDIANELKEKLSDLTGKQKQNVIEVIFGADIKDKFDKLEYVIGVVEDAIKNERPQKDAILVFNKGYELVNRSNSKLQAWVDPVLVQVDDSGKTVSSIKEYAEKRYQIVGVPIKSLGDEVQGFLYVVANLGEVDTEVAEIKRILFTGTMTAMVITIVLGLALARTIAQPIRKLTHRASEMAKGNYDQQINIKSKDEIGQLGEMFNSLASQLKLTLGEISNEKSKMEAILAYMSNGVIAFADNGSLILVNPKAIELLNLGNIEEKSLVNKILEKLVITNLNEVLAADKPLSREVKVDSPACTVLRIQHAPFERDGKPAGVIMVLQDITEQDKLEQMRRDFVANVSHELKTPLTNIKIRTQTLMDLYLDDELSVSELLHTIEANWRILGIQRNDVHKYLPVGSLSIHDLTPSQLKSLLDWQVERVHRKVLPVIELETDRMNRLVKDLLFLSQLDAQRMEWDSNPFSLQHIVSTVVERMRSAAYEKGLVLSLDLSDEVPPVVGSADRIEQVVVNIISNAIKYTPQGSVQVSVALEDNIAAVTVKDTGYGIPEEDVSRIFERFYRVDKARSRELGGTGLGLSIAKQLVEAHGGIINIVSTVGEGTTVRFTIPLHGEETD